MLLRYPIAIHFGKKSIVHFAAVILPALLLGSCVLQTAEQEFAAVKGDFGLRLRRANHALNSPAKHSRGTV